ncbi:MAG: drug resistance transporter, EmrB/QacA subfamily [Massilibacillus sp.]|jgi:EmrB/QacA subfamily drug resistance transporter|nr:drug resistance transporter, EmrB/QacA subfamily [Massilibacillus sp.]
MFEALKQTNYYRWLIFGVTALGTFMATLDASIVNVALPVISQKLGAELSVVQWVVSAYLLVISSLLPLFGKVGDMYGRRRVYLSGMVLFAIGSLICGMSNTIWMLVIARIVQAVGASMLMSNAPAIVSTTFPGKDRGRALGMNGTVVALGSLTGPSLGGILVGTLNWQSIFYINIPIAIAAVLFGYAILPADEQQTVKPFDYMGAVLFALAMTSLLLVVSHGQEWGWASPYVYSISLVAFIGFSAFFYHEIHVEYPMIELSLFKNWTLLSGNIAGMLSFMAMFSNNMLLPFYLHTILLLSPTQIGIAITPFPLLLAVTAPASGYLSEKMNPAILTTAGLSLTMGGLLYMSTLDASSTIWHVIISQAVMGIGNGLFQSPNNNSVLSSVPKSKVGLVSGINALVRNVGMVSGVAISVAVFENHKHQILSSIAQPDVSEQIAAFLSAYHASLIVAACFAGIGAMISFNRRGYLEKSPEKD